jgi:hypothetical protein
MNAIHTNPPEAPFRSMIPRKDPDTPRAKQNDKRGRPVLSGLLLCLILLAFLAPLTLVRNESSESIRGTESVAALSASTVGETAAEAGGPLNIIGLQSSRKTSSIHIQSGAGREGTATLVNLNPAVNAWYVLEIAWKDGASNFAYHLENARPRSQSLALDQKYPFGIAIFEGDKRYACDFFSGDSTGALDRARSSRQIHADLCEGRIYLRNPTRGNRTTVEAATKFIRDQGWGGEEVIVLFHHILQDRNLETGEIHPSAQMPANTRSGDPPGVPIAAAIDPKFAGQLVVSRNLEITPENPDSSGLRPGEWYPVRAISTRQRSNANELGRKLCRKIRRRVSGSSLVL